MWMQVRLKADRELNKAVAHLAWTGGEWTRNQDARFIYNYHGLNILIVGETMRSRITEDYVYRSSPTLYPEGNINYLALSE